MGCGGIPPLRKNVEVFPWQVSSFSALTKIVHVWPEGWGHGAGIVLCSCGVCCHGNTAASGMERGRSASAWDVVWRRHLRRLFRQRASRSVGWLRRQYTVCTAILSVDSRRSVDGAALWGDDGANERSSHSAEWSTGSANADPSCHKMPAILRFNVPSNLLSPTVVAIWARL